MKIAYYSISNRYNNYYAIMNAYMDVILIQVGPFLNHYFLPMTLPDVTEGFEYVSRYIFVVLSKYEWDSFLQRPIFITYHGELVLTNGEFHNMHSVARSTNAVMKYNTVSKLLSVGSEAKLRNLAVSQSYFPPTINQHQIQTVWNMLQVTNGDETWMINFNFIFDLFLLPLQKF